MWIDLLYWQMAQRHLKRCILRTEMNLHSEQAQQGERINCLHAEGYGAISEYAELKYLSGSHSPAWEPSGLSSVEALRDIRL